jgi:hypothetical protein
MNAVSCSHSDDTPPDAPGPEACRQCGLPQCGVNSHEGHYPYGMSRLACTLIKGHEGRHWNPHGRRAEVWPSGFQCRTLDIEEAIVLMMARYPGAQVRIEQGEDGDWGASLWEDRDDGEGTMRELGSAESDSITSALSILADGMDGEPL